MKRALLLLFFVPLYSVVKFDPAGKPVDHARGDESFGTFSVFNRQKRFNLLVSYYDNAERLSEIAFTIKKNVESPLIKKIYVFYETKTRIVPEFLSNKKVRIIFIDHTPSFKNFYDFANAKLRDQIVIVANADIFFDETLSLLKHVDFNKCAVALSRYRYADRGQFTIEHGQDCWIFKTPMKHSENDFKLGRYNTEYGFIYECLANGLFVINPCLSITTWHVHASRSRVVKHYIDDTLTNLPMFCIPFMTLSEARAVVDDVTKNRSRDEIIAFGSGITEAVFTQGFVRIAPGRFRRMVDTIVAHCGDRSYP